jgi:hypothetical protein
VCVKRQVQTMTDGVEGDYQQMKGCIKGIAGILPKVADWVNEWQTSRVACWFAIVGSPNSTSTVNT